MDDKKEKTHQAPQASTLREKEQEREDREHTIRPDIQPGHHHEHGASSAAEREGDQQAYHGTSNKTDGKHAHHNSPGASSCAECEDKQQRRK